MVVENNGLGYKVFVPADVLLQIKIDQEIELHTYQHVREDALQLFGFRRYEELRLFEQLISVSGVGPKTAMAVFGVASVQDIISAIVNNNADILKKVSGIGAKTAERIVLELKNKILPCASVAQIKSTEELGADADVVEALVGLGYSNFQVREALKKVDLEIKDIGEKVKAALKILNSKF